MKSPRVSGAQSYKELCIAAHNEEERQVELKKKQTYNSRSTGPSPHMPANAMAANRYDQSFKQRESQGEHRCYKCGSPDHLQQDCLEKKSESRERLPPDQLPLLLHLLRGSKEASAARRRTDLLQWITCLTCCIRQIQRER